MADTQSLTLADTVSALLLPILVAAAVPVAEADGFPELTGPYFGQPPPGAEAEVFAPDLVSLEGRYEFAVSFAPGGERMLFTVQTAEESVLVLHSQVKDRRWTRPEPVSLAGGARRDEMEAFFAPDGTRVFFAPYDEGLDVRIWQARIDGDRWVDPAPLAGPVADAPAFFPTSASSGALYFTNIAERRFYRATETADGTWQTEALAIQPGGHIFVAPDESFALTDGRGEDSRGKGDIFVTFATPDGSWTKRVNLGGGVNSEHSESCPSLSADGEVLFFSRYDEPGEVAQIYWVDSGVIDRARQRLRIEQVVHDSIAWAFTKDRARLEEIIAHDDDYFSFHPEGLEGVHGYAEFERGFDLWMDPRFEATRTEVRDFRCGLSRAGDVAWFSAILDDCFTWDGVPGCWDDTRWTGVLEQRDGRWQIVQMHFSFAADRSELPVGRE
jgi:hypothetical protein